MVTSDPIIGFSKLNFSYNIYIKENVWILAEFTGRSYTNYEKALEAGLFEALKLINYDRKTKTTKS